MQFACLCLQGKGDRWSCKALQCQKGAKYWQQIPWFQATGYKAYFISHWIVEGTRHRLAWSLPHGCTALNPRPLYLMTGPWGSVRLLPREKARESGTKKKGGGRIIQGKGKLAESQRNIPALHHGGSLSIWEGAKSIIPSNLSLPGPTVSGGKKFKPKLALLWYELSTYHLPLLASNVSESSTIESLH